MKNKILIINKTTQINGWLEVDATLSVCGREQRETFLISPQGFEVINERRYVVGFN